MGPYLVAGGRARQGAAIPGGRGLSRAGNISGGRGSCRAGMGSNLVAGLRAGQVWGQGQFECYCHQAAPQQAPQSPLEEQLPLQLHSQAQSLLWCSLSLQHMMNFVMQTMPAKPKHH